MNIVLIDPLHQHYYIIYTMESLHGGWVCCAKTVDNNGKIISMGDKQPSETIKDARNQARHRAKVKVKKKNYCVITIREMPDPVIAHLELPQYMQVPRDDLVKLIEEASEERYVIFKNVTGIEDFFVEGVEYMAHVTDNGMLKVFDACGMPHVCFPDRMHSVKETERGEEVSSLA